MKIFNYITLLICTFIFISCNGHDAQEFQEILNTSRVKQEIVKDLPLFDSAHQIIMNNFDTLLNHKKNKDKLENLMISSAWNFDNGYRVHVIDAPDPAHTDSAIRKSYPPGVYQPLFNVFNQIGKEKIEAFFVNKDSSVVFYLPGEVYNSEKVTVLHRLEWRPKFSRKVFKPDTDTIFRFRKDTAISKNWIYNIVLDPYMGM